MKKTFKGFTLVELIVVMAIMTIIMTALMNMLKPVRATYVDSTMYESQRSVQSGIGKYLAESTRYATSLGIYSKGGSKSYKVGDVTVNRSVSNVVSAVGFFLDDASGLTAANAMPATDASKLAQKTAAINAANAIRADLASRVEIITIDSSVNVAAYKFNGHDHYGRVIRRKKLPAITANAEVVSGEGRLAMGSGFYGDSDYNIALTIDGTDLTYSVSSVLASTVMPTPTVVTTETSANCKNLGVSASLVYDRAWKVLGQDRDVLADLSLTAPHFDTNLYTVPSQNNGAKTYIIYVNPVKN